MPKPHLHRLAVLAVLSLPVAAAENTETAARPDPSPSREILGHYVGHWSGHHDLVGVDGSTTRGTEEKGGRFVLGGKFVERRSVDAEGRSGLRLVGYDEQKKEYLSWYFSSSRTILKSLGKWDADTNTMTWRSTLNDLHMVDTEKHELGYLRLYMKTTDKRDRVVIHGQSDERRLSETVPEKLLTRSLDVVEASWVEELKQLQDFTGAWRETLTVDVPKREAIRGAGTCTVRWGLGGTVQLWRGHRETSLGAEEYLWVFTFDDREQAYRAWWFSSQGVALEYVGGRSPDSSEWRWQASGLPEDVKQSITIDAVSSSRIESRMVVKRSSSGQCITLQSTATRDQSPAN